MTSQIGKDRGIWLIGGTIDLITGCKLPSNRQILARFFHSHTNEKQTIQESARRTTMELLELWEKARIPTRQEYNIIVKIKNLYGQWQTLQKNASRKSDTQKHKEEAFTEALDDLFDVAHADAMSLIKIKEDKMFLEAQREKGRRGSMGPVDIKLARQEERRHKQESLQDLRKRKEEQRKKELVTTDVEVLSGSSETENDSSSDDMVPVFSASAEDVSHSKKQRVTNFFTPELGAALDRTKVSDRNATYILAAAAKSLGHNPAELTLNKESCRQFRRRNRENIATQIKKTFSPDTLLTVHWDTKLLPSLEIPQCGGSAKSVDRIAVLVSGCGLMKLLAVPSLQNGTGEAQAFAVYNALRDWNLTDSVCSMSFDTTASNTGSKSGACVLLEQKMNKKLLSLACRHHIHELIIARVFETLFETGGGPQIKLFQRFSSVWNIINVEAYESSISDIELTVKLNPIKDDILTFLKNQLHIHQPRDDYKELLNLAILFLGDLSGAANINAPGAYHRARWMAKLIYCFKIYLFRSQFHLTTRELSQLRQFNLFVVSIYLKVWFTCPCAASAPQQDLELLQKLVEYRITNKAVANAALKSFLHQLWYLSEHLVGLAFFDDNVSVENKILMVSALSRDEKNEPAKRNNLDIDNCDISSKRLSDFVTVNTRHIFVALDISQDFLREHPSKWTSLNSYLVAQVRVKSLKVVNDAAERGISLIQEFNPILTNQEEQKQFLLQVVEKHRREFPEPKKSKLVESVTATSSIEH